MISRETAEHYVWGGNCDGWHLVKRPELGIIHEIMPPGASEVRHYHQSVWQFFFVLAGTATLEIAGEHQTLQVHEGVEVPAGIPHQMLNKSQRELEFIVVSRPHSHSDRVLIP